MSVQEIFGKLWNDYSERTPSAQKIKDLFEESGNVVLNDHIALRTFNDKRVNIDAISTIFLKNGYVEKGEYQFPAKKLYAKHFEHATDKTPPLVFISELKLEELSIELQSIVNNTLNEVDFTAVNMEDIIFQGRLWNTPSYELYQTLLAESEYAGWMYINGFCAYHFTVNVNELDDFNTLEEVNAFIKDNGYTLNAAGGEIKGTKELFLEQSSVLADKITLEFEEGQYEVTSCYYEFAFRYYIEAGQLFRGFIANSADKIFESTDMIVK